MAYDPNLCAVCGAELYASRRIPVFLCKDDWEEYKQAVLDKAPWVQYLIHTEKERRRKRRKLQKLNIIEIPWRKDGRYEIQR